jgi:hypothetical protein
VRFLGGFCAAFGSVTRIPALRRTVDFDAAWERRFEGVIDAKTGLKAFFMSSADLVAAKLASGRPQDLGGCCRDTQGRRKPRERKKEARKRTALTSQPRSA